MSYELVNIDGISQIKTRDGREFSILNVKVTVQAQVFMNPEAVLLAGIYEKFAGRPALLACRLTVRDGQPSLQLLPGAKPFTPPPEMLEPGVSTMVLPAGELLDTSTGEVLPAVDSVGSSIFGKRGKDA